MPSRQDPLHAALSAYNRSVKRVGARASESAMREALRAYDDAVASTYRAKPQVDSVELLREIARSPFAQTQVFHGYTLAAIAEGIAGALDIDSGEPIEDAFSPDASYTGQDVIERLRVYSIRQQSLLKQVRAAAQQERRGHAP